MKVVGTQLEEQRNRAFNEGCDARLRGEKISMNPYAGGLSKFWTMGWWDVHKF